MPYTKLNNVKLIKKIYFDDPRRKSSKRNQEVQKLIFFVPYKIKENFRNL